MADVSKVLPSFDLFRGANKNSGSQVPILIGILLSDDNLVQSNVGNCSPLCSSARYSIYWAVTIPGWPESW
ncbi:unnamed protein product [Prunus armeniaca]|uniref:Uncharacterized protein n=1 Tax=Prunus armeniaca TaxID=36596 RepID=A0A6J5XTP2_PRUAR|nr:unnamed protein product [Prunus armeniaca]CAB4317149.1 unnamed protein product [Prunus armeniaca]